MKKTILLLSLLFTFQFSFSQNINPNLERDFLAFSKLVAENDPKVVNYMNPKIFEIIPKKEFEKIVKLLAKNSLLEYKTSEFNIKELGEPKIINNVHYVKMKVSTVKELRSVEKDLLEDSDILEMQADFEAMHGKENVSYDKSTGFFKVVVVGELIASSSDGQLNWKFMDLDKSDTKGFVKRIFPAEILE